jgi:hypothetical protein
MENIINANITKNMQIPIKTSNKSFNLDRWAFAATKLLAAFRFSGIV